MDRESFEALVTTVRDLQTGVDGLQEELEERVIASELAEREVDDKVEWLSPCDLEAAFQIFAMAIGDQLVVGLRVASHTFRPKTMRLCQREDGSGPDGAS